MLRYRQEGYRQGQPGCTWSRWLSGGSDFSSLPLPPPPTTDSAQVAAMLPGCLEMHLSADAAPSVAWMLRLGEGVTEKEKREKNLSCSRSLLPPTGVGGETERGCAANFRQGLYEQAIDAVATQLLDGFANICEQLLDDGPPLCILIKSPLSHRCKSVDNTTDFEVRV